jgi:hypothetical protein
MSKALQVAYITDLESLLARYKAHGDIDRVGTLSKENKRLAAYESKYRGLLQDFDREVVRAGDAAKEAAAQKAEAAAVQHMQARSMAVRAHRTELFLEQLPSVCMWQPSESLNPLIL